MVKNSGENGKNLGKGPSPKGEVAFDFSTDAVHPTDYGVIIEGVLSCSEPVTAKEAHEAAVEHYGGGPENVAVRALSGHQEAGEGKGSPVGFVGGWNSSWETDADRKKREKANQEKDGPTLL